jgi:homocysteine S-methyltransferase
MRDLLVIERILSDPGAFLLTDGGIETMLIFDDGQDLPSFAAFHLLRDESGRRALIRYYERFLAVAHAARVGFVLESPTWRANPDWAGALGYSAEALADANRAAIAMMRSLAESHRSTETPILVSGCVGPRGDGYVASATMDPETAQAYHDEQIGVMARAGADFITAITMTHTGEAIGVARAAQRHGKPSVISFTVETDGALPTGQTLQDAIAETDAATNAAPVYYMINCAHPDHFAPALADVAPWTTRIGGLRANAPRKSHAELNEATELDRGDPAELGAAHRMLRGQLPSLRVFGGCCGTDPRHVAAICEALRASR